MICCFLYWNWHLGVEFRREERRPCGLSSPSCLGCLLSLGDGLKLLYTYSTGRRISGLIQREHFACKGRSSIVESNCIDCDC